MKKWMCIMVTIVLLLVSSCGKKEEENKNISETTGKEKFTVGMECSVTSPYCWMTTTQTKTSIAATDTEYCDGYDAMAARKIAEYMNREIFLKVDTLDNLETALNNGEIDVIISSLNASDENKKIMDFTTPYYDSQIVMVVLADSSAAKNTDIQQFTKTKIAALSGSDYDALIDQIDGVSHQKAMDTYSSLISAVKKKTIAGFVTDSASAIRLLSTNSNLTIVYFDKGKGFTSETDLSKSVALKKGSSESDLFIAVQEAVDALNLETQQEMMETAINSMPIQ